MDYYLYFIFRFGIIKQTYRYTIIEEVIIINVYDFDKTIYYNDSTSDFYVFCLKRHPKIAAHFPKTMWAFIKYLLRINTKTQFKEVMYEFLHEVDIEKDLPDFWETHKNKIKPFYIEHKQDDDVIISASPEFLLEPICEITGIKHLMASRVDPKTGKYTGINCHGKEKVRRFSELYGDAVIDEFYSDAYCDTPLALKAVQSYMVKGDKVSAWKFRRKDNKK